jgi:nucleoside-diphosphate-sugar epimerase
VTISKKKIHNMASKVLITGSGGFIGSYLLENLNKSHAFEVHAVFHHALPTPSGASSFIIADLSSKDVWPQAISGIEVVIHTAARVHVMRETAADPLVAFRRVNVEGTLNIARQAAAAGVKRFVFLSSIKVNGEMSRPGQAFTAQDNPAPRDPYGVSKMEAESGLYNISRETGMEVVVIRPPLVYGPGVKGNFRKMLQLLDWGIPLPLGAIINLRSFVALDNLIDLLVTCIHHPAAANKAFMVSDGEDLSTPELFRKLAAAMGKRAHLFLVPPAILNAAADAIGKPQIAQRLCGFLQVDISKTKEMLGWTPIMSVEKGFKKTARWYLENKPRARFWPGFKTTNAHIQLCESHLRFMAASYDA